MISALWNGVSGITSYEKGIGVQSNNIANANSLAFKQDEISFEDLIYANDRAGKGVKYQDISKDFSQGNLNPTNSNIDVAIDGKGFFIVQDNAGKNFYTRAGNFIRAEDGFLKTQGDLKVMGFTSQIKSTGTNPTENIFTDQYVKNLSSITINSNKIATNINAKATNYINSAQSDLISKSGDNYKTSGSKISDVEATLSDYNQKLKLFQSNPTAVPTPSTNQTSKVDYSNVFSNLTTDNDFISITIDGNVIRQNFDTDAPTTVKKLSDKISNLQGFTSTVDATTGVFTIENLIAGKEFKVSDAIVNNNTTLSQVYTTNTQEAKQGSGLTMVESSRNALKKAVESAGAKFLELTNILSYNQNTIGSAGINTRLDALGLVKDAKGDISISDDGFVFLSLEGSQFLVGKIGTATFVNEDGLIPQGENLYASSKESGVAINGDAYNTIQSKFLENSNVNMGNSLTMLMVYQRAFEANSKSITTSDEMLKQAMDMKK